MVSPKSPSVDPQRIHVLLAKRGLGSRREIEAWIRTGYVHVNGKPAKLGQKVDLFTDEIKIKGKAIVTVPGGGKLVVLALNKPRNIVTTVKDPEGRKTVMDLIPKRPRVFPVGRLDYHSEGLLLLTNDGELAQHLTHPRYEVPKTYEVRIRGNMDDKKIAYLKRGVKAGSTRFKGAEILDIRDVTVEGIKKFQILMKIFEGKNQEIRRMFEVIKCHVIRLRRIAIGSLSVKGIRYGGYRILSDAAVVKLKKELGLVK